jgi:hypothetical protein
VVGCTVIEREPGPHATYQQSSMPLLLSGALTAPGMRVESCPASTVLDGRVRKGLSMSGFVGGVEGPLGVYLYLFMVFPTRRDSSADSDLGRLSIGRTGERKTESESSASGYSMSPVAHSSYIQPHM